jgi:hypothetical protein
LPGAIVASAIRSFGRRWSSRQDLWHLTWFVMKQLSLRARLVLAAVASLGICAYLVIADLGMNAGLIHSGVSVGEVEVGRMTGGEAFEALQDAGTEMAAAPVVFTTDGLPLYSWLPDELGWRPQASLLVERALKVGRRHALSKSLSERWSGYFGGVTIKWERPKGWRVTRAVDDVSADAALINLDVDETRMARLLRHAVRSWPRKELYQIPLM